jgi:hypothetical protein
MKSVAIMGAGSALKDFLSILPPSISVAGVADNNSMIHGSRVEGHCIHSPQELVALNADRYVITARAVDPMRSSCSILGSHRIALAPSIRAIATDSSRR